MRLFRTTDINIVPFIPEIWIPGNACKAARRHCWIAVDLVLVTLVEVRGAWPAVERLHILYNALTMHSQAPRLQWRF